MESARGPVNVDEVAEDRDLLQKLYALEDLLTEDEREVVLRCGEWVCESRPLSPDSRRMVTQIWERRRP